MAVHFSSSRLIVASSGGGVPPPLPRTAISSVRPCVDFHPSIWGDFFKSYSHKDADLTGELLQIQELKGGVRKKLEAAAKKPMQHLKMIDDIEGLGLGYHYEEEIEEGLDSMFSKGTDIIDGYDLYHTSLYFRLLRQHGYNVSSGIFDKFIDASGKIKNEVVDDLKGLLSLYEAAQLRVHREVILEQALDMSVSRLESIAPTLNPTLGAQVTSALKNPIHKNIHRIRARKYISTYQGDRSHDPILLRLAKLDFNWLQKLHQQELSQLSVWWDDLKVSLNYSYARDRLVEIYMFALAISYEPQHSLARSFFTKAMAIATILDDTYDAYGTTDEIELLSKAFDRWDKSLIEQMPDYLRALYLSFVNAHEEMEKNLAQEGRSYLVQYAKKSYQILAKFWYEEHKWLINSKIPTLEEYMQVGRETSGALLYSAYAMVGMSNDFVSEETFQWLFRVPNKMCKAGSLICRLKDDMVSHKYEQERLHAPSSVECYVNQYGVSEEETYKEFNKLVSLAWKDMNEECLKPTKVPFKALEVILNIARSAEVFYTDEDPLTISHKLIKKEITALLVDPVPI
uniref:Uncharacterized protein n=1 Tax=Kalanchoe fedtschenkoi TaxID=63787 RepID=A0A7N0REC0_KALFE